MSPRTRLLVEVAIVGSVSLGASAMYSVLRIIERLTRHVALNQQTSSINTAATPDRPWLSLLYQVAVHRMLRWRLPDYDPEQHLGGALYLFLRGMAGPTTPRVAGVPAGVFSWRPPSALITELSDLLDRGPS